MSKINNNINNNYHQHIKAKTNVNSNSNCSYQNINLNNKPSSPPSTVKPQFVKKKISSIKYQNTTDTNKASNKSNPNLILYPSSSKYKSQLKAINELL